MAAKKGQSEEIYVAVANPKEKRKNLLYVARDTLQILRDLEELKEKRKAKEKLKKEIENEMNEIIILFGKLKEKFPAKAVKPLPKVKRRKRVVEDKEEKSKEVKKKENKKEGRKKRSVKKDKLSVLEERLKDIERRLNDL